MDLGGGWFKLINKNMCYVIIYIMLLWLRLRCLQADTEEVGRAVGVPDE